MLPLAPEIADARGFERLFVRRAGDFAQMRRRAVLPADEASVKNVQALRTFNVERRNPTATLRRFNALTRYAYAAFFAFDFLLERGFHLLDNRFERRFVGDGEIGKNLAIETDAGGFQAFGETAVGEALRADGGVQALDPEIAESAFARFAIAIGPILGPSSSRLSRNGKVWNGGRDNLWLCRERVCVAPGWPGR